MSRDASSSAPGRHDGQQRELRGRRPSHAPNIAPPAEASLGTLIPRRPRRGQAQSCRGWAAAEPRCPRGGAAEPPNAPQGRAVSPLMTLCSPHRTSMPQGPARDRSAGAREDHHLRAGRRVAWRGRRPFRGRRPTRRRGPPRPPAGPVEAPRAAARPRAGRRRPRSLLIQVKSGPRPDAGLRGCPCRAEDTPRSVSEPLQSGRRARVAWWSAAMNLLNSSIDESARARFANTGS